MEIKELIMLKKIIRDGNMSSLNSLRILTLMERLLKLHGWADIKCTFRWYMKRYSYKNCRASAKNEKVAVCGYHGWHDWYLAANLKSKKNLNNHLIKNLDPKVFHQI